MVLIRQRAVNPAVGKQPFGFSLLFQRRCGSTTASVIHLQSRNLITDPLYALALITERERANETEGRTVYKGRIKRSIYSCM